MAFDMRYPTPLPNTKGWGPGWPNCQLDKRKQHPIFQGGVRLEIYELVGLLVKHLREKGYVFKPGWSWGWGCRATDKNAQPGDPNATPSFHSWGLALDFNAPENPFSRSAADTAKLNNEHKWVVGIMADYGFFWLGPSIGDWMHFSFCGSPADAKTMTDKARANLGEDEMTDAEKEQLSEALQKTRALEKAVEDFIEGTPPPNEASRTRKRAYRALLDASQSPAPGQHQHPDAPHTHTGSVTVE